MVQVVAWQQEYDKMEHYLRGFELIKKHISSDWTFKGIEILGPLWLTWINFYPSMDK